MAVRRTVAQGGTRAGKLADCTLCPRDCYVDRLADKFSVCRVGRHAIVSSYFPHFGEEDCLRGWRGSGTIFLLVLFAVPQPNRHPTISNRFQSENRLSHKQSTAYVDFMRVSPDSSAVSIFEKWQHLVSGHFVNWAVTRDGKYLVFTTSGMEPTLQRLRFADR